MSLTGWSGVVSTMFCLGASTLLLLREQRLAEVEKAGKAEWVRRWVLARLLLVMAALCVVGVWVLK